MAFHPLRTFQKHRKAFLAGITIMTMFIFVFSFSATRGGDFFSFVSQLVGAENRRYPTAAVLYGKKIDVYKLQQVQERRALANNFIEQAVQVAHKNVEQKLREATAKWEPGLQREVTQVLQSRLIRDLMMRNPQFAAQLQPTEVLAQIRQGQTTLNFLRQDLLEKKKADEANLVAQLMNVLEYESQRWQRPGEYYFGGSNRVDSTLDFMIWQHEADRLGVRLTREDIRDETDRETLRVLRSEQSRDIVQMVLGGGRRGYSAQDLRDALGEEFRVRIARAAVLGYDPGAYTQIPSAVTPHEFYDYFLRTRTEVSVALLPFAVKDFLVEVKEVPTEEQLRELFEKHKEQEYRPDVATPGFKQPRRVTVEYVYARPDAPHYRKASEVAAAVLQATWPAAVQAELVDAYDRLKYQYPLPPLTDASFVLPFYTDQKRPENIAATLGILGGAAGTRTSVLPAVVSYQAALVARADKAASQATVREAQRRIPVGATLVLAGAGPTPFTAAGLWTYMSRQPQYQPMEALQEQLLVRVREGLAREFLTKGLNEFGKALEANRGNPAQAAKKTEEFVKRYDLHVGKTEKPRDQYDIASDAGLKPLKDSYLRFVGTQDPRAKGFAVLFFDPAGLYDPQAWPSNRQISRGFPKTWMDPNEPFLYWKTSDKAAYVPTFEEVRAQVEHAWRLDKARLLARQAAEAAAARARQSDKGVVEALTEADKRAGTLFTLGDVALLKPQMQFRLGPSRNYQPYVVPENLVEYPRTDFADQLLTLTNPKDTVVLSDRPEDHFYVAGLVNRTAPSLDDFYVVYRNASPNSLSADPLLARLEQERQVSYFQSCMEQLRAEAKLTITEEGRKRMERTGGEMPAEEF
jgi:hypothetical protein